MARLETQINQIYYLPATSSQASLVLSDEVLSNNSHLFVVADLVKIQKKIEATDLQKISEIILNIFRGNTKLSGEALFETSLAEINQRLADLAHEGKKAWLGKFSALLVLKTSDQIFLANTGQMTALLYRGREFLEVLNPEKRGLHPLKTFSNFTAGKLKAADVLLLTSSNLFNYVALSNLTKIVADADTIEEVTQVVSKILKDTASPEEGFASFFITMSKAEAPAAATVATPKPAPTPVQAAAPQKVAPKIVPVAAPAATTIAAPIAEEEIYAPLPDTTAKSVAKISIPKLPKVSLPKIKFPKIRLPGFGFWQHISGWAKFFLVSFVIFLVLFTATIVNLLLHKNHKQAADQTQTTVDALVKDMNDAESALIYRNQSEAVKLLANANTELATLKNINPQAYDEYKSKLADLGNRINHITVVQNPTVVVTLKHTATDIARAGAGFFIADSDTGTITTFKTNSSDQSGKDLFLLNKIGQIKGLAYIPNTGGVVITSSEMYLINTTQSQFDLLHIYPKTDFERLHFVNPDRLYTIDNAADNVDRIQFSKDTQINPVTLLKGSVDLSTAQDIGTDTNVYVLSSTDLIRYFNGKLDANFKITQPTDKITSANRLFVANNIYVVESAKKRLLVYNKTGTLVTQIFFPNVTDIRDIYVDETSRNIFLLDSNRILSITF